MPKPTTGSREAPIALVGGSMVAVLAVAWVIGADPLFVRVDDSHAPAEQVSAATGRGPESGETRSAKALQSDSGAYEVDPGSCAEATAAATSPPAPDLAPDPAVAWGRFPRTDWDFVHRLVRSPETLSASHLFRNTGLNPSDVPIAAADRELLDELVRQFVEAVTVRNAEIAASRTSEMARLRMTGGTTVTPVREKRMPDGRVVEWIPMTDAGTVFEVSSVPGGEAVVHTAPVSRLPTTGELYQGRQSLIHELSSSVVGFFLALGTMDELGAREMQSRSRESLAATYR